MNQKSNKLTVPDLISVGVFTALYFVLVTVATFACALLPGVGNILLRAVAALISGSVYMLLAAKLQQFAASRQTWWPLRANTAAKSCCWPATSCFPMA